MNSVFNDFEHGGQLKKASRVFNIPLESWLDLSTGINPNPWPIPDIPKSAFSRLPESSPGLDALVEAYYRFDKNIHAYLHGAGSQAFLPLLPQLFERKYHRKAHVVVAGTSYCEHRLTWERYGHQVTLIEYGSETEIKRALSTIEEVDVLVIVNPNNPTGLLLSKDSLLNLLQQLRVNKSWLVVDEAFIDTCSNLSLCGDHRILEVDNLFIMRSVGKFFGLAGIRSGFIFANKRNITELEELQGPWSVSGPTCWLTERALADTGWQENIKLSINAAANRLQRLLDKYLSINDGKTVKTALFVSVWFGKEGQAQQIFESLARQGVLTRVFPTAGGLRFGLPANDVEWAQLEIALAKTFNALDASVLEIAHREV